MSCKKCKKQSCDCACNKPNNPGTAYAFPISSFIWTGAPISCNGVVVNTGDTIDQALAAVILRVCNIEIPPQGEQGIQGIQGEQGEQGIQGIQGIQGNPGQNGQSAYEIWISEGNTGTEQDFLDSFNGADGDDGVDGETGAPGANSLIYAFSYTGGGFPGLIGFDSNTTTSISEITISRTSLVGYSYVDFQPVNNANSWLSAINVGDRIQVYKADDSSIFGIYLVTNITSDPDAFTYTVTFIAGSGTFTMPMLLSTSYSIKGETGNNGFLIESIDLSDLLVKKNSETLDAGTIYAINENGVHILAISNNQLATEGTREMRIVKSEYYIPATGILGVWNSSLTPTIGDVVVWGGRVWQNVAGNVGANVDDITLDSEWTLIATSNDTYYESKVFGCTYDIDNNWVSKQWDERGNVFSYDYKTETSQIELGYNAIDVSDWGNSEVYYNKCMGVYNNLGSVFNNTILYRIFNNQTSNISENTNVGDIYGNTCIGVIKNACNGYINVNSCSGSIRSNSNNGDIIGCSNNGDIKYNKNNGTISNIGSANDNIQYNTNNGIIAATTTGDITDTIVNK